MQAVHGYEISPETIGDEAAIEALIEASFGPTRRTRTIYCYRDGIPPLSEFGFVVRHDDGVVASIRFWPVRLPSPDHTMVPLLGPLAVDPALRGYGLGRALVRHGLDAVREAGYPAVLIVGDPGYYAPFEFSVQPVSGLDMVGPVAPLTLMGIEFTPESLSVQRGTLEPFR